MEDQSETCLMNVTNETLHRGANLLDLLVVSFERTGFSFQNIPLTGVPGKMKQTERNADHSRCLRLVMMAEGNHTFPSRTRLLSPPAPMVLGPQGPGRVGRRQADPQHSCGFFVA